jgi:hypothetical protein
LIQRVECLNQHLYGFADLVAELIRDLLLILGALLEETKQRIGSVDTKEPVDSQQRMKCPQSDWFVKP